MYYLCFICLIKTNKTAQVSPIQRAERWLRIGRTFQKVKARRQQVVVFSVPLFGGFKGQLKGTAIWGPIPKKGHTRTARCL